jgi:hypothetical protein
VELTGTNRSCGLTILLSVLSKVRARDSNHEIPSDNGSLDVYRRIDFRLLGGVAAFSALEN